MSKKKNRESLHRPAQQIPATKPVEPEGAPEETEMEDGSTAEEAGEESPDVDDGHEKLKVDFAQLGHEHRGMREEHAALREEHNGLQKRIAELQSHADAIEKKHADVEQAAINHSDRAEGWKNRHAGVERQLQEKDVELSLALGIVALLKNFRTEIERIEQVKFTSPTWISICKRLDGK